RSVPFQVGAERSNADATSGNAGQVTEAALALAQLHGDVGLDRKVVDVERALGVGQRFSRAAGRLELCADGSLACEHQMTPSRLSTRKRIRRSTCLFSSASIA